MPVCPCSVSLHLPDRAFQTRTEAEEFCAGQEKCGGVTKSHWGQGGTKDTPSSGFVLTWPRRAGAGRRPAEVAAAALVRVRRNRRARDTPSCARRAAES